MRPFLLSFTIRSLRLFIASLCLPILVASEEARGNVQVVVQTGDDVPDGNGEIQLLNAPTINAAGQLAFYTQLSGTSGGSADNLALYRRDTNGSLSLVGRRGGTYAGKPIQAPFPALGYVTGSGNVGAVLLLGPPAETAYLFADGTSLTPMHTPGMPSPSGQANALLGVTSIVVNDAGAVVYRAVFNGAQPESGLYQRAVDGTHSVRLLNQSAAPRGGTITGSGSFPTINESNQIGTLLTINTVGSTTIRSAARIDGTTVHELVRQGDLLPDGVTTMGSFLSTSGFVNSTGKVAFAANLTQPGYGGQGVFLADDGGATLVATGVLSGATTAATNMQVVGIGDAGRVAFTTEFNGGIDPLSGIYLTGSGSPTRIALEDTAVPTPGKFFRAFLSGGTTINDAGQIAFIADLSDTVNGAAAGRGVFFYDEASGLQQVARVGDSLNGSTITSVFFNGTVNGVSSVGPDTSITGLNNLGQVAFSFSLANGTDGAAIWTKPAGIAGDYNSNGVVDAADYVAWRKGGTLANEVDAPGTISGADYTAWRARFGNLTGSGSAEALATQLAVPEPATFSLLAVAMLSCRARRRAG